MKDKRYTNTELNVIMDQAGRSSARTNALLEADAIKNNGRYPQAVNRDASSSMQAMLAKRGIHSY